MEDTLNKKMGRGVLLIKTVLIVAAWMLFANGNDARAAGMLVADGGFGGVLEIVDHDVKVTINNGIAVTEVTQVFQNMEKRQVEALYTFPVPEEASVSNFSMWINGKEMVGEVLEKKRAREIYNSYKQQRRDPGLLEQKDFKTFEMRIFPIGPEARQKVQIIYYQELDFDHDTATYVYPLSSTTTGSLDTRVTGRFSVAADIKSAIPITSVSSPSHGKSVLIVDHNENYHEASMENRNGDLAKDVVLTVQVKRPVTGLDLIASNTRGEDGYFSLSLTAGQELEKIQTGADYVFILDISGSMANQEKLSTSANSIEAFIRSLGQEDRFEIITFNRRPAPLFSRLVEYDEIQVEKAAAFLNSQEASGGTALQPALQTAYKYATPDRPLNAVIMSDGMTEQSERRILLTMIGNRPVNTRVFCIGVGNEVDRSLLKQIAEDAGGISAFLSRGDDFARQAQAFRRKLMHPVATGLKIKIDGVEVYDIVPETLPNLYHGVPVKIYGRYRKSGQAVVEISGEVNGRKISTGSKIDFPELDENNPEIERMWAWQTMEKLQRTYDINKSTTTLDEVIRLGEAYSITSEYTSFLVLENDSEYQRWKIERRNASRITRDRKAQARLRSELQAMRNISLDNIGPNGKESRTEIVQASSARAQIPVKQQVKTPPSSNNPPAPKRGSDLPSFGGGGAMDPVSGIIGLFLAGGAFCRRKRKK